MMEICRRRVRGAYFASDGSGFVEPGESLEEAARREALEETGVRVGNVTYHRYAAPPTALTAARSRGHFRRT